MAEILFDENGVRMVLLSRSFGDSGHDQEELRVRFTDTGSTFFHFFQDGAPRKYDLTAGEADDFCEQWLAYHTELRAQAETEKQHQEAIIAKAFKIAEENPAIKIKGHYSPGEKNAWKVSVPSIAWGHQGPVSSPQELLDLTHQAWNAYQSHQRLITSSATAGGDAA